MLVKCPVKRMATFLPRQLGNLLKSLWPGLGRTNLKTPRCCVVTIPLCILLTGSIRLASASLLATVTFPPGVRPCVSESRVSVTAMLVSGLLPGAVFLGMRKRMKVLLKNPGLLLNDPRPESMQSQVTLVDLPTMLFSRLASPKLWPSARTCAVLTGNAVLFTSAYVSLATMFALDSIRLP